MWPNCMVYADGNCTGGHKTSEVIPKAASSNRLQQTSSKVAMGNDDTRWWHILGNPDITDSLSRWVLCGSLARKSPLWSTLLSPRVWTRMSAVFLDENLNYKSLSSKPEIILEIIAMKSTHLCTERGEG